MVQQYTYVCMHAHVHTHAHALAHARTHTHTIYIYIYIYLATCLSTYPTLVQTSSSVRRVIASFHLPAM